MERSNQDEIGGESSRHVTEEKCIHLFGRKPEEKKPLGSPDVDGIGQQRNTAL
jgi:hypothetical protein